jgi:pectate lyase
MGMEKKMVESSTKVLFIFLVTFAITIPCLEAGIAEFDAFLKAQADEAHQLALDSYIPVPEEVAHDLNFHVHLYVSL